MAVSASDFRYTIEKVKNVFSKVSFDNLYQVTFPVGNYSNWLTGSDLTRTTLDTDGFDLFQKVGLLCTQAELPGTQYATTQVVGDRQGLIELFPTIRSYPPLNLTFYVDTSHVIIKFFETWMNYISPINKTDRSDSTFSRLRYPDTYKDTIRIIKFEKDTLYQEERPGVSESLYKSNMLSYELTKAWPVNIASMPVSYGNSNVMKVTVTFQYDRYYVSEITQTGLESKLFNSSNILNK